MPSDCRWRDEAYKVREYQRGRRVNAVVSMFWVVALFALLYRADVTEGERAAVPHSVIGQVIQDFETLCVQVAHSPMTKVSVMLWRHSDGFVR